MAPCTCEVHDVHVRTKGSHMFNSSRHDCPDPPFQSIVQEELRKMGSGRCPGDIVMRVVRCCDTIFALLDPGRRRIRRGKGDAASAWRPDLDPAGTADVFLPVLIYVVLRARVPRLHSMCEYVQAFHSPVALMSRWELKSFLPGLVEQSVVYGHD